MRTHRNSAPRWLWPAVGALAVALFLGGLTGRYLTIRATRIADAKAWTVAGPPCPQVTEAEMMQEPGAGLRSFEYGEATFVRRRGEAECAPIYEDGGRGDTFHPVCRFSRPGDVQVRTVDGAWQFRPGPGRPVVVTVWPGGRASCVIAGAPARSREQG